MIKRIIVSIFGAATGIFIGFHIIIYFGSFFLDRYSVGCAYCATFIAIFIILILFIILAWKSSHKNAGIIMKCVKWIIIIAGIVIVLQAGMYIHALYSISKTRDELRCRDVAIGKDIVRELTEIIQEEGCNEEKIREMLSQKKSSGGELWYIKFDKEACSYTLFVTTYSMAPMWNSAYLSYDSKEKKWEITCDDSSWYPECQ